MTDGAAFVLSNSGWVHTPECPTIRHRVDEHPRPPEQPGHVYETLGVDERGRTIIAESRAPEVPESYHAAYVTAEDLAARTTKYTRCRVCAPDVPEFQPQLRVVTKPAGALIRSDLGRPGLEAVLVAIHHAADHVKVTYDNGETHDMSPGDEVSFYDRRSLAKVREHAAKTR